MKVAFNDLGRTNNLIGEEIRGAIDDVLAANWYILGEKDKEFERQYAEFNEAKHCIGVSNGLDALHLCLASLNLPEDAEVIVPANTFIATALAVSYCNLKLKLVDVDEKTMLIDVNKLEQAITPKTKVIMPVHLYGSACDMDAIMSIADKYGLYVIEDNAQAQGCRYKGKLTGSFGICSGTSFYPGKNIGALGDAGAVVTNSDEIERKVRALANYGAEKRYHHTEKGFNTRMDELQAAILSVKLKHLNDWNSLRNKIANYYLENITNEKVVLPYIPFNTVWHLFVLRIKDGLRDDFVDYLEKNGIQTTIHYPITVNKQDAYKEEFLGESYPVAEMLAKEVVSIPMFPHMTEEEMKYVVDTINNWK